MMRKPEKRAEMTILEIEKNGKPIGRVGGDFIESMHTTVSYRNVKRRVRLVSTGLNIPDRKSSEHVHWFEAVNLEPGDEVRIRVTEASNADPPVVDGHYGTFGPEDGPTAFYCSFCGAEASADVKVLVGGTANICYTCLRRHNPDRDKP